jgi:ParB-like nuclease family protein
MSTSPNVRPADSVMIRLERIPTDAAGQTRTKVRDARVREYAAAMIEQLADGGLRFPPVILFQDGNDYALADGFHRVLAAAWAGLTEIAAHVHPGSRRDAILFGISANNEHGLPRTKADKRKAVQLLLTDPEWSQWNNREIARRCGVGHTLVNRMRQGASGLKVLSSHTFRCEPSLARCPALDAWTRIQW